MTEALELLRLQVEWGADEALDHVPPDRLQRKPSPRAPVTAPVLMAASGGGVASRAEVVAGSCGDLAGLRDALLAFEGIELKQTAGQLVLGDGPEDARLVFVIEAPSAEDDAEGRPLSGARGEFFQAMLRSIGLAREEVRVACLLPWRPPGGRPPSTVELGACAPFLRAQLRLMRSLRFAVLMGATPARVLGGAEGRGWRGRWFEVAVEGRMPLPGLAMAAIDEIAGEAKAKAAAWADLLALKRRLDGAPITIA